MSATLTITGTAGPGLTVSAAVYAGVRSFCVDTEKNMVTFKDENERWVEISVAAATTVTATKSGSTWTLTIS